MNAHEVYYHITYPINPILPPYSDNNISEKSYFFNFFDTLVTKRKVNIYNNLNEQEVGKVKVLLLHI